ncbi:hypothetical protein ACFV4N_13225 [Actinosynnema sp. NPDC059797]
MPATRWRRPPTGRPSGTEARPRHVARPRRGVPGQVRQRVGQVAHQRLPGAVRPARRRRSSPAATKRNGAGPTGGAPAAGTDAAHQPSGEAAEPTTPPSAVSDATAAGSGSPTTAVTRRVAARDRPAAQGGPHHRGANPLG